MPGEQNARVTIRELHKVQLDVRDIQADLVKGQADMEQRVLDKLEPLNSLVNQVETNKDEIEKLRTKSNVADRANAALSVFLATLAGWIGTR